MINDADKIAAAIDRADTAARAARAAGDPRSLDQLRADFITAATTTAWPHENHPTPTPDSRPADTSSRPTTTSTTDTTTTTAEPGSTPDPDPTSDPHSTTGLGSTTNPDPTASATIDGASPRTSGVDGSSDPAGQADSIGPPPGRHEPDSTTDGDSATTSGVDGSGDPPDRADPIGIPRGTRQPESTTEGALATTSDVDGSGDPPDQADPIGIPRGSREPDHLDPPGGPSTPHPPSAGLPDTDAIRDADVGTDVDTDTDTDTADGGDGDADAADGHGVAGDLARFGPIRAHPPGRVWIVVPITTALGLDEQPCELPGHGWVSAAQAREIITTPGSTWQTLLADTTTGHALSLSRRGYRPTAEMIAHVQAVDGTCRAPGCLTPAPRCDLDHITAYDHHDPHAVTHVADLASADRRHHRIKTTGLWTAVRGTGQTPAAAGSSDQTLTPCPTEVTALPRPHHPSEAEHTLTWTTAAGRRYTTHPKDYLESVRPPADDHPAQPVTAALPDQDLEPPPF